MRSGIRIKIGDICTIDVTRASFHCKMRTMLHHTLMKLVDDMTGWYYAAMWSKTTGKSVLQKSALLNVQRADLL